MQDRGLIHLSATTIQIPPNTSKTGRRLGGDAISGAPDGSYPTSETLDGVGLAPPSPTTPTPHEADPHPRRRPRRCHPRESWREAGLGRARAAQARHAQAIQAPGPSGRGRYSASMGTSRCSRCSGGGSRSLDTERSASVLSAPALVRAQRRNHRGTRIPCRWNSPTTTRPPRRGGLARARSFTPSVLTSFPSPTPGGPGHPSRRRTTLRRPTSEQDTHPCSRTPAR